MAIAWNAFKEKAAETQLNGVLFRIGEYSHFPLLEVAQRKLH